ncbi:hypothetical protein DL768_002560 [Monosporascus sp. mg162]|nr:hypothetical protein DL768_002560 [Monosporascus sp. mg162]
MLAIFKAGGAFVPIGPSYSTSRIQAITEATNAPIVLAEPTHCRLFEGIVELIVPLEPQSADELPASSTVTRPPVSPSNTAYVVFTSGSTGAPKGIMVEHRALCTAAQSLAAPMRVSSRIRFLQFAAYTFDLNYGNIFITLSQGGCICVPSENERVNDLAGGIVRMNANTACLICSVARMIQPWDVPSLETLLLGGEALLRETLDLWAGKVFRGQMYGPSEATVWYTSKEGLKTDSAVNNIGRGLASVGEEVCRELTDKDSPEETVDRKPVNGLGTRPNLDDPYELRLRQILGRILDKCVGDSGVEQSFDSLGGDSFSAMDFVAGCKAEGLALTVQEGLSSSTIRQMASAIKMRKGHATEKCAERRKLLCKKGVELRSRLVGCSARAGKCWGMS